MATASLAGAAAAATQSGASATRASIAQNFDSFLNLLTTQLKNQSPLDPLDTNQFTQQLVQFAGVEQQLKTNESLTALLASTRSSTITSALGFVGATVTADGSSTRLADGKAEWRLQVPRTVAGASVTVTDKSGGVVFTETRGFSAGEQTYAWRGRTTGGAVAPDGEYAISIAARDASGQTVAVKTELRGAVTGVDVSGAEPVLSIGNLNVPVSKVKTIQTTVP
jgi:flagellar basal-body rod modification protein FlgD